LKHIIVEGINCEKNIAENEFQIFSTGNFMVLGEDFNVKLFLYNSSIMATYSMSVSNFEL
jgi:hypothetical protein